MSFDLSVAWETVQRMLTGFAAALPRLLLASVLVAISYLLAKGVRAAIRRNAQHRGAHQTLELAVGRLAQAGIVSISTTYTETNHRDRFGNRFSLKGRAVFRDAGGREHERNIYDVFLTVAGMTPR